MHEAGIAQAALGHIVEQSRIHGRGRATRVVLRIGALSGVDPEALRFALEAILPDSPVAGACVEFELVSALARCPVCRTEFQPGASLFECPACKALGATVVQGRELDLVRIDFTETP
jgi:hydrogenase nickel incorporation protein HypA/HybF